ncbi:glycosyltransferase involved in cell wall biosynthesis [Arthrobacter pascens]|uniref:glycosyltransferase family 4 protein n=1 Tax=Arthrobacter pascens TaxID=1677 RepID=UPI0028541C3B|nr:glycosyltransferase family 4 protein [Arthrobacter pascens]MDR6557798.1 glycosyltransferase involved in cell wall biosynthesis [Arthrobacter pascens]
MQPRPAAVRLLVPGNILHNSGGNVYNASLVRGLAQLGVSATVERVDGNWPVGSSEDRRRFARLLGEGSAAPDEGPAGGTVTIVDGLIASGAPEALEAAAAAGQRPWILLHMVLLDHPELEIRALSAAAGVICTSGSVAAEITRRHGTGNVHVALPGTDVGEPAEGSDPPHLVSIAALLPNKDQLIVLGALSLLQDLQWTAALVGSDEADPGYARDVRAALQESGLEARVRLAGELKGQALENEWHAADLSLLVSKVEAFGMAVTESLARGVPVVVRAGTGAVEALNLGAQHGTTPEGDESPLPGAVVVLDSDPAPLAETLRSWLTSPERQAAWRRAALAGRERLPGWDATARCVLDVIGAATPQAGHS